MRNNRFGLLFWIFMVTIFANVNVSHANEYSVNMSCEKLLPVAVKNFVQMAFPDTKLTYTIEAYNDLLCENLEDMANVVIVVWGDTLLSHYGIFHLHYAHDGTVPRIPASFLNEMWTPLNAENDWQKTWCDIIRSVYPTDKEKFECQ